VAKPTRLLLLVLKQVSTVTDFQISPQAVNGALQGQLIITSPNTTKIVSTKYVTHTASGTSGTGGKTWSFDWVAPVA
jgi:hypothetical protein